MRYGLFAVGFTLLFFTVIQADAQSLLKAGKIPADLQIRLSRSACFGICPDYSLTIEADGKVIFEGGNFTGTKGKVEDKIGKAVLKEIIAEFEQAEFFNLKDKYVDEEDGCGEVWTDSPTETIAIKLNGKTKEVRHYFGCEKVPGNDLERIIKLGKKIDRLTNMNRWVNG
jgi:hypothetical protein